MFEESNKPQLEPRVALFLCSGNYFRSRFSEELFNHWARRLALPWQAESRGLVSDLSGLRNVGKISPHTVKALSVRGIRPAGADRWPTPVSRAELEYADLVIALKESEHRPMAERRFPDLVEKIEFWQVDDIDVVPASVGIKQAEQKLLELIRRLR
jgi:protein-tyrosine phosphatase